MGDHATIFALALDARTLLVIAAWIAALLGMFLLLAWIADRKSRALAWWSTAYIIGGSAVASWTLGAGNAAAFAREVPSALLFLSLGMIWTGARLFYGRGIRPVALVAGAVVWLIAANWPGFALEGAVRSILSALGIAVYAFLTAAEVWRDRRSRKHPYWQTVLMPLLHASVFLCPVLLPALIPGTAGGTASEAWVTALTLSTLLYAVGTAFLILALIEDRNIRMHKDAASIDPLTGLFNRRAFLECAQQLIDECAAKREPVTLLMFDLDNFKAINDCYGHATGDETLRVFAKTAIAAMRVDDTIGRLGGEEFGAIVPGDGAIAVSIAERVRLAFEQAAAEIAGRPTNATVSIGAAWTAEKAPAGLVLADADAALYRAKAAGRNRVMLAERPVSAPQLNPDLPAATAGDGDDRWTWRDVGFEVGPPRRRALEGGGLPRTVVSLTGMLDGNEEGFVVGSKMRTAELRAGGHPIKVA